MLETVEAIASIRRQLPGSRSCPLMETWASPDLLMGIIKSRAPFRQGRKVRKAHFSSRAYPGSSEASVVQSYPSLPHPPILTFLQRHSPVNFLFTTQTLFSDKMTENNKFRSKQKDISGKKNVLSKRRAS